MVKFVVCCLTMCIFLVFTGCWILVNSERFLVYLNVRQYISTDYEENADCQLREWVHALHILKISKENVTWCTAICVFKACCKNLIMDYQLESSVTKLQLCISVINQTDSNELDRQTENSDTRNEACILLLKRAREF